MKALLLLAFLCGCGEARQRPANVFEKSWLDARWRYQVALLDAPAPVSALITKTPAPSVGFEALEGYLIARADGDALAAWPIYAHFDDPPQTAAPGDGIIYEDGLRPWWQRSLMRVDFSLELVPNLAGWSAWPEGVTVEPVAYEVPLQRRFADDRLVALEVLGRLLVGDALVVTRHSFTRD